VIFKILYYLVAGVCGFVGIVTLWVSIKEHINYRPYDYCFDFSPLWAGFGALLTLASYFMFRG
jgi:hypothetical protein